MRGGQLPRFHPLKSGRNLGLVGLIGKMEGSFHPLKSGRNAYALVREIKKPEFPSPQVGSERLRAADLRCHFGCFHPLKSGRNQLGYLPTQRAGIVSIPSSRVGTVSGSMTKCRALTFPSPQVGSEPFPHQWFPSSLFAVSIPSSRVGTVVFNSIVADAFWFPSPQVGSELALKILLKWLLRGFHPLKSGRNMLADERNRAFWAVSIPSSRVGTRNAANWN